MRAASRFRWLLPGPFLLVLAGSALEAQDRASLAVVVRTAGDARPLPGAEVVVVGANAGGATDDRGLLRLPDLPAGRWIVAIQYIGYGSVVRPVDLHPNETTILAAELALEPIELAPVEAATESALSRRGFYDRKRTGNGTFLNRNDIEKMRPRYLSDVLRRVGGINVGSDSRGRPPARIRGQQTIVGGCPIQYFIDGVVTTAYNIDEMQPGDVDGIEIYRGAASIPAAFKRGTATCGVIVLWTKVR